MINDYKEYKLKKNIEKFINMGKKKINFLYLKKIYIYFFNIFNNI
jgi:hypothetical protein